MGLVIYGVVVVIIGISIGYLLNKWELNNKRKKIDELTRAYQALEETLVQAERNQKVYKEILEKNPKD